VNARLSPHDLRQSFAKLVHKGRAALEQIQFSLALGHVSILTTEKYWGAPEPTDAPSDHLGIHGIGESKNGAERKMRCRISSPDHGQPIRHPPPEGDGFLRAILFLIVFWRQALPMSQQLAQ
jgi:hypothetical protein